MIKKMMIVVALCWTSAQAQAMVIWDWDGTNLLGAQNVDVGGTLYNVSFIDGSCVDLFNGCDEVSDFDFVTRAQALVASQALMDQVFITGMGAPALIDSVPYLTNGCEPFWFQVGGAGGGTVDDCWISTPTLDGFSSPSGTATAFNNDVEFFDGIGGAALSASQSYIGTNFSTARITYADWSLVSAKVPAPGVLWLFGTALFGLLISNRVKRLRR